MIIGCCDMHDFKKEVLIFNATTTPVQCLSVYRGSYMSANVLLNLLKELRKSGKM